MELKSIAKNDYYEIKATGTGNFLLYSFGVCIAHLCPEQIESLRGILLTPILPGE